MSVLVTGDDSTGVWRLPDRPAERIALFDLPPSNGLHPDSFRTARHVVFVVSELSDTDTREVAQAMAGPVARALEGV